MNPTDFTKLKPASYNRKSSEAEDRQMLSIDSQIDEAQRISDYYKLPAFIKVFKESKSAKAENVRPEFREMISMVKEGKIDAVVCWKPDRLARNMTEGGIIIDLLSSGVIKAIITHDKVYYPTDNVMLLSIEFSQGKQFVKELSVNVKRGQKKKAEMGVPHGVASIGFRNDKTEEKGNRRWLVDDERLWKVEKLFRMFLTGAYSAGKLYKYAINELKLTTARHKRSGGKLIANSRIYEILKDPIYAGFFTYGGERFALDKALPRLITEAEHEKVRMILSGRNVSKSQKHNTATYSGFIRSSEGNFMGQDVKHQVICECKRKFACKNKTQCPSCGRNVDDLDGSKYLNYCFYYDVKRKKARDGYKSIEESRITGEVSEFINENLTFSPLLVEWSKKHVHLIKDRELAEKILKEKDKESRREEYSNKKANYRKLLADSKITHDEYLEDMDGLGKQYADIHEEAEKVNWYSEMIEMVDLTASVAEVMEKGSCQAKRGMLSKLGSNLTWDGKNLIITNKKSINALVEAIKRIKLVYPEFEPKNYVVNKGEKEKTPLENEVFSMMLPLLDEFRTLNWFQIRRELSYAGY